MSKFIDLTGKRFFYLTAIKREETVERKGKLRWICLCDCGKTVAVITSNLTSGNTKSCGCYHDSGFQNRKHGMRKSKEYGIWFAMRARCNKPQNKGYADYGGRGIKVCEKWSIFEEFYKDMGPRPEGSSLDRIDNDGNYEPENCRWATPKEQSNNQRSSLLIQHMDETMTLKQWCEKLNLSYIKIYRKVQKQGIPFEEAIL